MKDMPAKNAPLPFPCLQALRDLGDRLRLRRKQLALSTVVVAEAAQVSRATLYRVETGEPAVTLGTYLAVMHALGLSLQDMAPPTAAAIATVAATNDILLANFPQLRALAWHIPGLEQITRNEARGIYTRHWRHLDKQALTASERALILSLGLEPSHV